MQSTYPCRPHGRHTLLFVAVAFAACNGGDGNGGGNGGGDSRVGGDSWTSCDDGVRNGTDLCDGSDVGTRTCQDEGFAGGGVLVCNSTCDGYVTTGCFATAGEDCAAPQPVLASGTITGDTTEATADYTLSCGASAPDVVYSLTLDADAGVTLRTRGYDTVIELRGAPCASGTVVACNDDEPDSLEVGSLIRLGLLPAGEYFLIVSGFVRTSSIAAGPFSLEVEIAPGGYARCGDDTLQPELGEICDGVDLDELDCGSFGWDPGGTLACNDVCRGFDFDGCSTTAVCPDGQVSGPELCDGSNFDGNSCESLGYTGGELACAGDCLSWDVSGCVGRSGCGDGVRQGLEACDGDAPPLFLGIEVIGCDELNLGDGALACTDDCTVDVTGCSEPDLCARTGAYDNGECEPCELLGGSTDPDCAVVCGADGTCADTFSPWAGVYACQNAGLTDPDCGVCGDGLAAAPEQCDGEDLAAATCGGLGYYAVGKLGCRPDCSFDASECQWCGDGTVQTAEGELCDGEDVGLHTCFELGFDDGVLLCNSVCRGFDTGGCTTAEICGNESIAGPEVCDGDTMTETCQSLGFYGGALSCAQDCLSHDVSGCYGFSTCGDGVAVYREICDGSDFNNELLDSFLGVTAVVPDCEDLDLGAGTVSCNTDCTLNISGCDDSDLCRAPAYQYFTDEICDACELLGGDVDPACATACLQNGVCADLFDPLVQRRTCLHAVAADDPDCRRRCGDGLVGAEEHCDGDDLDGRACEDLGFTGGVLGCLLDCSYDVTGCIGP